MADNLETKYQQFLSMGQQAGARYSLVTPRNIPQGLTGAKMGNRPGSSLEFMDHREYQPGDDLRRIDWSAYARSDKLTVKLYREEVNPHVDLIIDGSRSMILANSPKAEGLLGLAGLLAEAAVNAGYSHRGWQAGQACREIINSELRPATWSGFDFEYAGNPGESFAGRQSKWRDRGIRILLSDLLWLDDPQISLSYMAEKATSVIVIQVLAQSDVEPGRRGNIRLVDSETREVMEVFVDASAQKRYQDRLARHQQNWHRTCRQYGAAMVTLVADQLIKDWNIMELLRQNILQVK